MALIKDVKLPTIKNPLAKPTYNRNVGPATKPANQLRYEQSKTRAAASAAVKQAVSGAISGIMSGGLYQNYLKPTTEQTHLGLMGRPTAYAGLQDDRRQAISAYQASTLYGAQRTLGANAPDNLSGRYFANLERDRRNDYRTVLAPLNDPRAYDVGNTRLPGLKAPPAPYVDQAYWDRVNRDRARHLAVESTNLPLATGSSGMLLDFRPPNLPTPAGPSLPPAGGSGGGGRGWSGGGGGGSSQGGRFFYGNVLWRI
jgi:hypothetical protein